MPWQPHDNIDLEGIKSSVVVVSDSLFSGETELVNDISGPLAIELISEAGFHTINLDHYPDDFAALKSKIESDIIHDHRLILLIGGTGIALQDVTIEALKSVLDKELPGFGEEFRRRSIEQIQGKGILSRALAGTQGKSVIIAMPGSPKAVKLGIEIVLSFIGHALNLLGN